MDLMSYQEGFMGVCIALEFSMDFAPGVCLAAHSCLTIQATICMTSIAISVHLNQFHWFVSLFMGLRPRYQWNSQACQ
jgi:hypothetical protein